MKNSAKELSHRLKLKIYNHNENLIKKNKIIRNSYKFCSYKNSCNYNYNKNKKGCYADHYVHNMVFADVDVLIKYLKHYNVSNLFLWLKT